MAVREIRVFGDPILRTKCEEITEITDGVRAHVQDLLDTVAFDGRAGLASNQIGRNLRAFSLHIDGQISYVLNPVLKVWGDIVNIGEGCLSVPELWFNTPRYTNASVQGIDLDLNPVKIEGTGLLAQALQHECDHLEGKVYLQRLDSAARKEALARVRAAEWF